MSIQSEMSRYEQAWLSPPEDDDEAITQDDLIMAEIEIEEDRRAERWIE